MSNKTKGLLVALIAAVAAALTAYLQGCSPAQLQSADRAFETAQAELACIRSVERENADLLANPKAVTLAAAERLAEGLKACAKPAPAADAGAQ